MMSSSIPLVIDSDTGTDVDDILAIVAAIGENSLDLRGITTVYGDTLRRAQIARHVCDLAGTPVPVHAGLSRTLRGAEAWWPGFEGENYTALSQAVVDSTDAVDFLCRTAADRPGELNILAIAPLSNIASAIQHDEEFASNVGHLYVMGGCFGARHPEHNFEADIDAARIVFSSGIRCTVTPFDATETVILTADDYARIASEGALGSLIGRELETFLRYMDDVVESWRGRDWSQPHDVMALLPLLDESRYTFRKGAIEILDDGSSVFHDVPDGVTRLMSSWNAADDHDVIMRLVLTGCALSASEG